MPQEILPLNPQNLAEDAEASRGQSTDKFNEFIFKVYSRCNLACTYCFMYEGPDQSWREQPNMMSRETFLQAAIRVAEHRQDDEDPVTVIFHGGEPLLAEKVDPTFYPWATGLLRNLLGERVRFAMQTNGTRITEEILDKMAYLGVRLGVSADGLQQFHDKNRIYPNKKGSYADVRRGIVTLAQYERGDVAKGRPPRRGVYGGLLCYINLDADPLATYRTLTQMSYDPPNLDLLLPLATWDDPPPGYTDDRTRTPYADWLIPIYDEYTMNQDSQYKKPKHRIRIFDAITELVLGRPSRVEYLGLTPPTNVVVETNGEIQSVDALKTVAEGEPSLGLHVSRNTFEDALNHPKTVGRRAGFEGLAAECQRCELVEICGGGYYGERYSSGNGYDNTSVYHPDLVKLITHIRTSVRQRMARASLDVLAAR